MIVLVSFHANAALLVFTILVAATLIVAWRAASATGAVAAAAAFVFVVFAEWAVRGNPEMLVLPGGRCQASVLPPLIAPFRCNLITAAISLPDRCRRIPGAGPLDERNHTGGVVGYRVFVPLRWLIGFTPASRISIAQFHLRFWRSCWLQPLRRRPKP